MARYKVPQDVEAEDKLLGPFTFRQFIYLIIGAVCVAAAWGLAQIFFALAIIPIPFALFFFILALPLKKDQPMETYLSAILSFYTKPSKRLWSPGQRESTILITAPKKQEKSRTRNITEDEASHRLSFLANLVDTEGAAIRGYNSSIRDEYIAEATQTNDILDQPNTNIDRIIANEQSERRSALISQMQSAVRLADSISPESSSFSASTPTIPSAESRLSNLTNLAHNNAFSIQTIADQARRYGQSTPISSNDYQPYPPQAIFTQPEGK